MKPRRDWIPPTVDDIVAYPVTRGQILYFAGWFVVVGAIMTALSRLGFGAELSEQRRAILLMLGGMAMFVAIGAAAWRVARWRVVIVGGDAIAEVTGRTQELTGNGVLTRLGLRFDAADGPVVGSRLVHPVVWRSVQVGDTVRIRYLPDWPKAWVAVGEQVQGPYPPQSRHLLRLGLTLVAVELMLAGLFFVSS